jgi:hypothetical protein
VETALLFPPSVIVLVSPARLCLAAVPDDKGFGFVWVESPLSVNHL